MRLLLIILISLLSQLSYSTESNVSFNSKISHHASINCTSGLATVDLICDNFDEDDFDFLKKIPQPNFVIFRQVIFSAFPASFQNISNQETKHPKSILHKICVLRL